MSRKTSLHFMRIQPTIIHFLFNGFLAKTYFNSNAQIIPFLNSSVFAALNVVRFDIMAIHENYIITTTFLIHYIDFGD